MIWSGPSIDCIVPLCANKD
jgi:hypothetical protein